MLYGDGLVLLDIVLLFVSLQNFLNDLVFVGVKIKEVGDLEALNLFVGFEGQSLVHKESLHIANVVLALVFVS